MKIKLNLVAFLKLSQDLVVNLTSAWIGVVFASPSIFNISWSEYLRILPGNLLFAIVGLTISYWFTKEIEEK